MARKDIIKTTGKTEAHVIASCKQHWIRVNCPDFDNDVRECFCFQEIPTEVLLKGQRVSCLQVTLKWLRKICERE